jgi:hypothetical protein
MNVRPLDIHQAVASQREVTGEAIERVLKSAAKHHRKASVTVTYTAKHDKDAPHVLVLSSVLKVKEPKGPRIDVTGTSEAAELMRVKVGDEPGQQEIPND